jgi:hypothetical protein
MANEHVPPDIPVDPYERKPKLTLVPCDHFWLEVRTVPNQVVIAICNRRGCRKRGTFTMEDWGALAQEGRALNKPVRV